jgi:hypothetical protein
MIVGALVFVLLVLLALWIWGKLGHPCGCA